jgi:hypothetical protein
MRREANSALSDRASCSARYHHADQGRWGRLPRKLRIAARRVTHRHAVCEIERCNSKDIGHSRGNT